MNKYTKTYFNGVTEKLAYSAAPNGVQLVPNPQLIMPSQKRMIQEGEMDLINYSDDAVSGPSAVRQSANPNIPSISIRGDQDWKSVDRLSDGSKITQSGSTRWSPLPSADGMSNSSFDQRRQQAIVPTTPETKGLLNQFKKGPIGTPPSRRGDYMGTPQPSVLGSLGSLTSSLTGLGVGAGRALMTGAQKAKETLLNPAINPLNVPAAFGNLGKFLGENLSPSGYVKSRINKDIALTNAAKNIPPGLNDFKNMRKMDPNTGEILPLPPPAMGSR